MALVRLLRSFGADALAADTAGRVAVAYASGASAPAVRAELLDPALQWLMEAARSTDDGAPPPRPRYVIFSAELPLYVMVSENMTGDIQHRLSFALMIAQTTARMCCCMPACLVTSPPLTASTCTRGTTGRRLWKPSAQTTWGSLRRLRAKAQT